MSQFRWSDATRLLLPTSTSELRRSRDEKDAYEISRRESLDEPWGYHCVNIGMFTEAWRVVAGDWSQGSGPDVY